MASIDTTIIEVGINVLTIDYDTETDKETMELDINDATMDENESTDDNESQEIVYGYNEKTDHWHCTQCGISMGPNNPRQLCRKYYCPMQTIYS